jgi:hypothetical protein
MTISSPTPFVEALSRLDRPVAPTTLSSAEIAALDQEVTNKALLSARTMYSDLLEEYRRGLADLANPRTELRVLADGHQKPVTVGMNPAELRTRIKGLLDQLGYRPEEGKEGTIEDLGSDQRINLVIFMNSRDAAGYGQFRRNQDAALLWSHPALEMVRFEERDEKRNWLERWRGLGGKVFFGTGLDGKEGRLIARKDDAIWFELSRFGRPWPPFDFNSGVGLRPVTRAEAVRLGVIKAEDRVGRLEVSFAEATDRLKPGLRTEEQEGEGSWV